MKTYGIRGDYVARTAAATVSDDASRYWNERRIASSALFQYEVYRKAARQLLASERRAFADVGCGYPRKVRELISPITGDVTLMDHPSMAAIIERDFPEMTFVPIDLEQPGDSLPRRRFDCVVCADVVEHLLDPEPLLELLDRLLAPHGRLFLSTPERDVLRGRDCRRSPKLEHVREWTSDEFQRFVSASGLAIEEHLLLPQKRLRPLEEALLPVLRKIFPRRYRACQLAVCAARA